MLTIVINDKEYELATTLRVAYNIQGQHNHKSYLEIFGEIDKMTLEQQIGIVYSAFQAANQEETKFIKANEFLNVFLDTYNLKELMDYVQSIIKGIMGEDFDVPPVESESTEGSGEAQVF